MKSKIIENKCIKTFPYLAVTKQGPNIIVFVTRESDTMLYGAVIYADDESWLGDTSTTWLKESFTRFNGTIEISN